jgi:STE24 endopeptidase
VIVAVVCVLAGRALWDTTVPDDLRLGEVPDALFGREEVEEAQDFEALARVLALASLVALIAALAVFAKRGPRLMRQSAAGPIGTGFMLAILGFCIVWIVQLPFGLAETWWARRYDLVEIGYFEWFLSSFGGLSGMALQVSIVLGVVMGFAKLVRSAWWLPSIAVFGGIVLFFAWVGPYLVVDLDDPSPEIAADVRELSTKRDLPDVPVQVEKVKEFTSAPNAYAFGLGETRKVVLWDTLADDFPRREVRVVLAHELAHHEHAHIAKSIGWLLIVLFPTALIVAIATRRKGGMALPDAVPLALLVFTVLNVVATPLQSAATRNYEREADWAALEATRDPQGMEALFKRFTSDGNSDPNPPGWWHLWFDSHPSGADRVAMARAWAARQERAAASTAPGR